MPIVESALIQDLAAKFHFLFMGCDLGRVPIVEPDLMN